MFRPPLLLLSVFPAVLLCAEPEEKPLGRSLNQRFGGIDQKLVFDPGQGAVGQGRSFQTGGAQMKTFNYDQHFSPGKFETHEFSQKKTSWLSAFNFFGKHGAPSAKFDTAYATKAAETKSAPTKDAPDRTKTVAVRGVSDGTRTYLGPERKKLDRAVDPTKPLPGWAGDKMETLTLEQIRELLNKNK